jgi:mutator protein MutT
VSGEPETIAVAVVHWEGQYLIGRRPPHVRQGGLWEFPGGKILPGETVEQAAIRECQEETGLAVQALGCLRVVEHRYNDSPSGSPGTEPYTVRIAFIACQPVGGRAAPKSRFRWVAAEQLARCEFPAANAEVIAELVRHPGRLTSSDG